MDQDRKDRIARPLGQIPSGCFIMTAAHGGSSNALLASWVQQAGFEPPMVTVAVRKGRAIEPLVEASGHFVLNLITESGKPQMFRHFGKGFDSGEDAFAGLATHARPAGIVLDECGGHLGCRLVGRLDAGDHTVYLGEVIDGAAGADAKPYVHVRTSGFHY